jgi:hypothetical protein
MKLLFNNENQGSRELKELIPYIDADLLFQNLQPDINTATNEVAKIIGKELYNILLNVYDESDALSSYKDELLKAIRYPIAVNAYRLYSPSNDLGHTNNGRKMLSDDGEKQAFEWMIDRDNTAQEKRYYRSLEDMITFLDNSRDCKDIQDPDAERIFEKSIYDTWTSSEAFIETNNLFIRTVDDFDRVFPIKSRLLLMMLTPGISDCETYEIIPRITFSKMEGLKTKLKSREPIEGANDLKLIKLIKRATAFYAMAWALPRFSVQLYPEGVLQHYTSDKATTKGMKPTLNIESEAAAQAFKQDSDKALLEIELMMVPTKTLQEMQELPILPNIISGDQFFSM